MWLWRLSSEICSQKLETREILWCRSSSSLKVWEPEKPSVKVQKLWLETQEEPRCQFESKGRERSCPSSKQSDRRRSLKPKGKSGSIFYSSLGRIRAPHNGEGHLLYSACGWICSSHPQKNPTAIPGIMFDPISGYPVIQSSWHIKLTIT